MPDSSIHRHITECALRLAPLEGGNAELVREYCTYPDKYFSDPAHLKKYMYFTDSVQFHYPPDTPINELYRYWDCREDGKFFRVFPYVNKNFVHVHGGFQFCLRNAVGLIDKNDVEEGKKYLGTLLHMLEDATYGLHSLEGPGGSDAFVLNRLMDSDTVSPSELLVRACIAPSDLRPPQYAPRLLGDSIDETVMRLWGEYCSATSRSRKICFRIAMNSMEGREKENAALLRKMFENSVRLVSDVIYTVSVLSSEHETIPHECRLTELEPYEFPFGGHGGYRFRSFERDRLFARNGKVLPLELETAGGRKKFVSGISFGSHAEGALFYWIAPEVFSSFHAWAGLYPDSPAKVPFMLEVVNKGKAVEKIELNETNRTVEISVPAPSGDFGIRFSSAPSCGVFILGDAIFTPAAADFTTNERKS